MDNIPVVSPPFPPSLPPPRPPSVPFRLPSPPTNTHTRRVPLSSISSCAPWLTEPSSETPSSLPLLWLRGTLEGEGGKEGGKEGGREGGRERGREVAARQTFTL